MTPPTAEVAALFTADEFRSRLECTAHDAESFSRQLSFAIAAWNGDELDPALQKMRYVEADCRELARMLRSAIA